MSWNMSLLPTDVLRSLPELPSPIEHHIEPAPLPQHALVLDVRSYAEFMSGHVDGARCLPLPRLLEDIVHVAPDPDHPIVLYCASGARAEQALGLLRRMGYHQCFNGGTPADLAGKMGRAVRQGM
ncbi:rhodanese-like domain-containing protein [Roseateles sp.]|jgi:phage shock protein E|uniref:rhodanese-like domain-containing protein n=1 Tax=Roseateles sp. TaxID=1971397 RepID=UPI0037C56A20